MGKRAKTAEIATSVSSRGATAVTAIGTGSLRVTIPGTDEQAAQALLVDMLKLGGSTRRKARIAAPSTDAMERRGSAYLASEDPVPNEREVWRVRIWYRSQGDETLTCDSDLMSRRAAESLASSMTCPSDAINAQIWNTTAAEGTAFAEPRSNVRHVTLPHAHGRLAMGEVTDSGWLVAPVVEVATAPIVEAKPRARRPRPSKNADLGAGGYYAGSPTGHPGDASAPIATAPIPAPVVRPLRGAGAYTLRRAA